MANRFEFNERGMFSVFQSKGGEVGKSLDHRGTVVQLAAKRQVGKDTHLLERSIVKRWGRGPTGRGAAKAGDLIMRVGSNRSYALVHHEGSRPHLIRPRNPNGVLRFQKGGKVIFARVVHHPGTAPNHYLSDNLHLAIR